MIGAVARVLVIAAMELLEHWRIDDPVGAWPVHGVCGIWGTLSLGLFASGEYSAAGSSPTGVPEVIAKSPQALTGLFYGGGATVLKAQVVGSLIVCAATFGAAKAMFKVLDAMKLFRVSAAGEIEGLDLDQHGNRAYPEYVISSLGSSYAVDGAGSESAAMASTAAASAE